jgi:hypothetical protein
MYSVSRHRRAAIVLDELNPVEEIVGCTSMSESILSCHMRIDVMAPQDHRAQKCQRSARQTRNACCSYCPVAYVSNDLPGREAMCLETSHANASLDTAVDGPLLETIEYDQMLVAVTIRRWYSNGSA